MSTFDLRTPLCELDWIPSQRSRQFERLELKTVGDLLTHYPRRYEDRRKFDRFPEQESDTPVCVCGIVGKDCREAASRVEEAFRGRAGEEGSHALSPTLHCRWFNAHWVEKMIGTGQRLVVFGKPKLRKKTIGIAHPDFEIVEDDADISIHLKRIAPVYRCDRRSVAARAAKFDFSRLRSLANVDLEDRLPATLIPCRFAMRLRQIHFPGSWEDLNKAKRHLVLCEFFAMQTLHRGETRGISLAQPGALHCGRAN